MPVGGDLEGGGAGEAAVGDEELFAEGGGTAGAWLGFGWGEGCDGFGGDSGEVGPGGEVGGGEGEGDEGGAGLDDPVAELAGEVVAEGGGAHFGYGEASGGDDDGSGLDGAGGGVDLEVGCAAGYGVDAGGELDSDVGFGALAGEEVDDVAGGAVAEELAESFLVVGDAVALDEVEEVVGGVAGEGGAGEVGVVRQEVLGGGV